MKEQPVSDKALCIGFAVTAQAGDEGEHEGLEEKPTAELHKIVKKRILEHNACEGQLDELVD